MSRQLISMPLLREGQVRAIKKRGEKQPVRMFTELRSRAIADTMDSIAEQLASLDVSDVTNLSEFGKRMRRHRALRHRLFQ
jgi:hypothetical protein